MPVAATSKIKKPAVPKAKADLEPIRDAERTRRAHP